MKTTVTYPIQNISTLKPEIAFFSPTHIAVQAQISGDNFSWDSGEVESTGYTIASGMLPSGRKLNSRVRVRTEEGWQDWSEPVEFTTPASPVVRIRKPAHAGRMTGPNVTIEWEVESDEPIHQLSLRLDGEQIDIKDLIINSSCTKDVNLEAGLHILEIQADTQGRTTTATAQFYVWNSPQMEGDLLVLDLREAADWPVGDDPNSARRMYDLLHTAACLQGMVNRKGPRLMLRIFEEDSSWLDYLREPGGWLENVNIEEIRHPGGPEVTLLEGVRRFRDCISGLVVWDESVPATSNVATTVAGVEDLLPVRSTLEDGALADLLMREGLEVKVDLRGMFPCGATIPGTDIPTSRSVKCDAYLWAKAHYLDTGRVNPRKLGYWLDSFWLTNPLRQPWWEHCLSNHDWIVFNRGFLFDLSNWGDEAPQDDLHQPAGTDLETFKTIMLSAYQQAKGEMIHVAGFTPWAFKYTNHALPPGAYEPVASEWEIVRILSAYNAYLDADAHGISAMANSSLWTQMPMADRYVQNPPPTLDELQSRGLIDREGELAPLGFTLLYVGDYDSAAWLNRRMQKLWADPERGNVPMGWAFNPNLCERMAPALHFAFSRMSSQDFFTAGDSGAGYVNPTMLLEPRPISDLPSGSDAWIRHSRDMFRKFNYRITGFLINGHAGKLTEESQQMSAEFSPDGFASQRAWLDGHGHLCGNTPVALQFHDLCPDIPPSVNCMSGYRHEGLQFLNFRIILLGPGYVKELMQEMAKARPDAPLALLDPWAFYYLLRHHLGGSNARRATFTFDTLGSKLLANSAVDVKVGIRNDGWDTWKAGETCLEWGLQTKVEWSEAQRVPLGEDVPPGGSAIFTVRVPVPSDAGEYKWFYALRDNAGSFRDSGCPWWESSVFVE